MLKIKSFAVVELVRASHGEPACQVVLTDENLVGTVDQVHRIHQTQVTSQILTNANMQYPI